MPSDASHLGGNPLSVLLVATDDDRAQLIRSMLEKHSASPAQEASVVLTLVKAGDLTQDSLSLCENLPPEVTLVDLTDTLAATYLCRLTLAHFPHLPLVALVEHDDATTPARLFEAGAHDYLTYRKVDRHTLLRSLVLARERHRRAQAHLLQYQRYQQAVVGAHDGLVDWDLETDTVRCCERAQALLELGEEVPGDTYLNRVHSLDRKGYQSSLSSLLSGRLPRLEYQHRVTHKDRAPRWLLTRIAVSAYKNGAATRLTGLITDVTARKRAEQRLLHDALHDPLTRLANRALFIDRLRLFLVRAKRHTTRQFAVLFFDLDGFKTVNDAFGHAVGDQLLVQVATRLKQALRPEDALSRFGGDEFAVLIDDAVDIKGAAHVAQRIQKLLQQGFLVDGHRITISASIGIVLNNPEHLSPHDVLRQADTAMYRAKAAGKGCYEVFDQAMHQSAVRLLTMERELRQALQRDEFEMFYQPIVSLTSGAIMGFEGLVRWHHPQRGLVAPAKFLSVAEESGIIIPLGWWVLNQACSQISHWQRLHPTTPPLIISVNISEKLFAQADMVDRVIAVLQDTGLAPECLHLEVPETTVTRSGEPTITKLIELRGLGVKVAIDDFGTGTSSLLVLQRLRCASVKIDPSFVHQITQGGESRELVSSILTLASALGVGVIAEGVETADQARSLRKLSCPHGQGFLFAKPLPAPAAEKLLDREPQQKTHDD